MQNSDPAGEKRPFSVVPIRAARDRRLKISHLRVLMALGYYANRAGVCWPSLKSLQADTAIDPSTCLTHCQDLVKWGYMRLLEPSAYNQKRGAWGYSNRYQLLWRGDEPAPTWEEVKHSNALQAPDVQELIEGTGARGSEEEKAIARRLNEAFLVEVETATGYRPQPSRPSVADHALLDAGITIEQMREATRRIALADIAARRGPPSYQRVSEALLEAVQNSNDRKGQEQGSPASDIAIAQEK